MMKFRMTLLQSRSLKSIETIDLIHVLGAYVFTYLLTFLVSDGMISVECSCFKCIWLWLRLKRLPRPLSGVAICLFYNPPASSVQDVRDLVEYITDTSDKLRNIYPDCAIVILGPFNNYDPQNLISNQGFKQVVLQSTRGSAILDLIYCY